jgi:Family of unknown function (DUF6130)
MALSVDAWDNQMHVGHPTGGGIHVTVDDAPWHCVDASGETVIVVGLKPGPHKVLFELADPTHEVSTSQTVTFTVRDRNTPSKSNDPRCETSSEGRLRRCSRSPSEARGTRNTFSPDR